jgi:hypothetical protein
MSEAARLVVRPERFILCGGWLEVRSDPFLGMRQRSIAATVLARVLGLAISLAWSLLGSHSL